MSIQKINNFNSILLHLYDQFDSEIDEHLVKYDVFIDVECITSLYQFLINELEEVLDES